MVVAIRGAITVEENERETILSATQRMIKELMEKNNLVEEDLISLIFTVTPDLNQAFPALGARMYGINNTPLMCSNEIPVAGSLEKCIRVLVHCHSSLSKSEVRHIYLERAVSLRRDLVEGGQHEMS